MSSIPGDHHFSTWKSTKKKKKWIPVFWPVARGEGFAPEINAETESNRRGTGIIFCRLLGRVLPEEHYIDNITWKMSKVPFAFLYVNNAGSKRQPPLPENIQGF